MVEYTAARERAGGFSLGGDDLTVEVAAGTDPGLPLTSPRLRQLCELAHRGLFTVEQVWALFEQCELFMVRPAYYGMPVFRAADGRVMTPVFSSVQRLAAFAGSAEWVRLPGSRLRRLPVQVRIMVVDPLDEDRLLLDARTRPADEEPEEELPFAIVDIASDEQGKLIRTLKGTGRAAQEEGEDE